jgi:hypothetical protein
VFPSASVNQPTAIKELDIKIRFRAEFRGQPELRNIQYRLVLMDSNGNEVSFRHDRGDLSPFMTAQQINQAQAFLQALLDKAVAEVLGL